MKAIIEMNSFDDSPISSNTEFGIFACHAFLVEFMPTNILDIVHFFIFCNI